MAVVWDISGDEIQTWSQRVDAFFKLPALVRRLLLATTPLGTVDMRADGGAWLSGWDGIVSAHRGTAYCPPGASVWELTTRKATRAKLDEDFEKRKKDAPSGVVPGEVAYVVVTAQRFEDKAGWAAERTKEGLFKAVRVFDADDLATWLTQAPAVARWFGAMIGKPTSDLFDLESFASEWSARTSPALPFDLLLAGRERERAADLVRAWPRASRPSPLFVRADTKDEAISFVAAALDRATGPEREQFRARTMIVESRDALRWAQRGGVGEPALLLPHYDDFEPKDAVRHSFVIVPLDGSTPPGQNEIRLGPVPHRRIAEILVRAGIPEVEAKNRAQESGGKLASLQRLYGYTAPPAWIAHFDRTLVSVLLLVGAWQPDNEADRDVIRALGSDPGEVRKLCEELSLVPDAATVKDVEHWGHTTWTFRAPGEIWQALAGGIPGEVLQRFQAVATEVLSKADPRYELKQDERFAAAAHGKALKESAKSREGLARSLARLAQSDQQLDALHGPGAGSRIAQIVVRRVLEPTWIRWASVSGVLPLLAEAAPEVFLDRLEESLTKGDEGVEHLLAEEGQSSSPHTGLLWALETLGWSSVLVGRVARALAALSQRDLDPKLERPGRLANRPVRSLRRLLHYSYPCTLAPLEERLDVFRDLLDQLPDIAYPVLLGMLRSVNMPDLMLAQHEPQILPWELPTEEERQERARRDATKTIDAMIDLAVSHAATDAKRWCELLNAAYPLPDRMALDVLDRLDKRREKIGDNAGSLWAALRECISRAQTEGRKREKFQRALELYGKLEPLDPTLRIVWLFEPNAQPTELSPDEKWQDREKTLLSLRLAALQTIWDRDDRWDFLREFTVHVSDSHTLGWALGHSVFAQDLEVRFIESTPDSIYAPLVKPYTLGRWHGMAEDEKHEWIACALHRLVAQHRADEAVQIARGVTMGADLWTLVESLGEPTRTTYWQTLDRVYDEQSPDPNYWEYAIRHLLDAGNLGAAMDTIGGSANHVSADITARALDALLRSPEELANFSRRPFAEDVLEKILNRLQNNASVNPELLGAAELAYFRISNGSARSSKFLSIAFTLHPDQFVDLIKQMYRADGEVEPARPEEIEQRQKQAETAYRILDDWHGYPGESAPDDEREKVIEDWSVAVLGLTAAQGRAEVGAIEVAKVLARVPTTTDGDWPCVAARRLLKGGRSTSLRAGLYAAKLNLRGMTGRSLGEGGKQERELAQQFRTSAEALRAEWPDTATLLDELREHYERDAQMEDAEAAATLRRTGSEREDFEQPQSPPPPSPRRAVVADGIVQLTSIELQDVCALESLKFELSPAAEKQGQWVVLLGENGTGKTSILRALAVAVGGPNIARDALNNVPAGLVRQEKMEGTCLVEGPGVTYSMTIGALPREHVERFGPEERTPRPLLFGYGCRRGSALGGQEPTRVEAQSSDVATLFDEKERVLPSRGWLKDLWILTRDREGDPDRVHDNVYNQVRTKLCELLPGEKTRIEVDANEVWIIGSDVGGRVPLAALSDGYLTTLGWAADLVQRWLSWADRRGIKPAGDFFAEQMDGLVLLDEVDLHLHPHWQREIIPKIRKVFPRMSFVVTTHNALTLLGARADEIWILRRDEGGIVAEQGRQSPALMTSSQIYAAYFGITSLYPELGEKLRRYGFLAGTSARTEAEETEVYALLAVLRGKGIDPGWEPVPREEPPAFLEDEEDAPS